MRFRCGRGPRHGRKFIPGSGIRRGFVVGIRVIDPLENIAADIPDHSAIGQGSGPTLEKGSTACAGTIGLNIAI